MNGLAICGLLCAWILVATGTSLYRNSSRAATVIAAAPAAIMITILQRPVYRVVDSVLGGHNWLSLAHQVLCVLAVTLFFRLIIHASENTGTESRKTATRYVSRRQAVTVIGGCAIVSQFLLFPWGSALPSDPWLEGGDGDPRVAVYSSISWLALTAVAVVGLPAAMSEIRRRTSRTMMMSLAVAAVGAVGAILATLLQFTLLVEGFIGTPTGELRETMIDAVNLAGGTITLGFSLPYLAQTAYAIHRSVCERLLLLKLHTVWERLGVANASILVWSPNANAWQDALTLRASARLQRRWVEVNDHLVVHPTVTLEGLETSIIRDVEQRLHSELGYAHG